VNRLARIAIIAFATTAALAPLPHNLVEAWYSNRLYPSIQTAVTPLTNRVPFALLDVAFLIVLGIVLLRFVRGIRRRGFGRTVVGGFLPFATLVSIVYLVFLAMWGLNYRRVPIEQKLTFDDGRVTRDAVRKLGEQAVGMLNTSYDAAHVWSRRSPARRNGSVPDGLQRQACPNGPSWVSIFATPRLMA
jgi:hypothetical protein